MGFEVGRVDHDRLSPRAFGGQTLHHPGKDALITPPLPAVVEGLRRTILLRSVAPPQTVALDENDAAQNPPVIDAWLAVALWKFGETENSLEDCFSDKTAATGPSARSSA